ncbi:MAG: four helix bundle protein [Balneolaceae bacterium]|nr:four helix bundle protein [Balneolaceae bacterium]
MNKQQLEDRLIRFAVQIISLSENIAPTKAGNHLTGQLIRSGTSPALNYGESRSAESLKDFIHKLQIILKELRESFISLKILSEARLLSDEEILNDAIKECDELISIFVKSIQTSKRKYGK